MWPNYAQMSKLSLERSRSRSDEVSVLSICSLIVNRSSANCAMHYRFSSCYCFICAHSSISSWTSLLEEQTASFQTAAITAMEIQTHRSRGVTVTAILTPWISSTTVGVSGSQLGIAKETTWPCRSTTSGSISAFNHVIRHHLFGSGLHDKFITNTKL